MGSVHSAALSLTHLGPPIPTSLPSSNLLPPSGRSGADCPPAPVVLIMVECHFFLFPTAAKLQDKLLQFRVQLLHWLLHLAGGGVSGNVTTVVQGCPRSGILSRSPDEAVSSNPKKASASGVEEVYTSKSRPDLIETADKITPLQSSRNKPRQPDGPRRPKRCLNLEHGVVTYDTHVGGRRQPSSADGLPGCSRGRPHPCGQRKGQERK